MPSRSIAAAKVPSAVKVPTCSLQDHRLRPRPAAPAGVSPRIGRRVDRAASARARHRPAPAPPDRAPRGRRRARTRRPRRPRRDVPRTSPRRRGHRVVGAVEAEATRCSAGAHRRNRAPPSTAGPQAGRTPRPSACAPAASPGRNVARTASAAGLGERLAALEIGARTAGGRSAAPRRRSSGPAPCFKCEAKSISPHQP